MKKIKKSANSMDEFWILNFLFVFFLSLINSTFYVFFRQNLEIHFSLPIIAIFILIISTLSPIVIKKKIKFKNHTYNNLFYPLVALLIFLLPILGNFYKEIFYLYIFLFILILFNFKLFLNISVNLNQIIKLFILAFLLSIFLINSINELNHAHFFSTEQMDLGVMNYDTRFHIALTHIIQNFNISSLGTHGYIPLNLHVFANWYFASFGNFLNLDPVWVVSGIPFFLIIPIFFFFYSIVQLHLIITV